MKGLPKLREIQTYLSNERKARVARDTNVTIKERNVEVARDSNITIK